METKANAITAFFALHLISIRLFAVLMQPPPGGKIAAAVLDSFGLPTLYWEKLPTISLALAVALIGICERNGLQTVSQLESALEMESLPQHT